MEAFGFCPQFRRLVAKCVSSVSFSVLLNGGPLKQFRPERGLRQGDPLSPYLFIMCNEILSRMLIKAENDGLMGGFRVSRQSPSISHLMYADDTFIFCEASLEKVLATQECLDRFCLASGQCINVHKSALTFSANVDPSLKSELKEALGFRDMCGDDRFLGNPILLSGSRVKEFNFLIEKLARRIEGWKSKLLSQAGRLTLLQSVASSTPVYTMSTFLIPKTISHALDKMCRSFWWTGETDKSHFLALASWDSICLPKERGGLNLKKFKDFNLALIAKLGWRLASGSESPWCSLFRAKYFKHNQSFWSAPSRSTMSFGARGIMASRDLIRNEACFLVGSGRNVDIWHSPWVPWLSWEEYVASFNPRIQERGVTVNSLLLSDSSWSMEEMGRMFRPSLSTMMGSITNLSSSTPDELIWKASKDGSFSVKVAYQAIIRGRSGLEDELWKLIWRSKVYERAKCFLWKTARDILPFGSRLHQIFGNISTCTLCLAEEDSPIHLFFGCDVAKQIWRSGPWGICSEALVFQDNKAMVRWLLTPSNLPLANAGERSRFTLYAIMVCFHLWKYRNMVFHDGIKWPIPKLQQAILADANSLAELKTVEELQPHTPTVADMALGLDTRQYPWSNFNIFVDAAVRGRFGIVALIVFDLTGQVVEAATSRHEVGSALEAELVAIREAYALSDRRNWANSLVLSDCQVVVAGLKAKRCPDWTVRCCFDRSLQAMSAAPISGLVWIPRRLNVAAHDLAAWAANFSCFRALSDREVAPFVATMNFVF
uniref:Reverse transcriptase domain-containing protein n=1 Tax=Cannabis sativa TaxID=3483 RepID=A0A803Q9A6_CANSA